MSGKFVDLNAEEIEKNVDKYSVAIGKAAKFFTKVEGDELYFLRHLWILPKP
jgi:hypothetical protein